MLYGYLNTCHVGFCGYRCALMVNWTGTNQPHDRWEPAKSPPSKRGVRWQLQVVCNLQSLPSLSGFFFMAAKYGGIDSSWCIYGGNHPHLLRNVFWCQKKNPDHYATTINPLYPRDSKMGFWLRKFWKNFWSAVVRFHNILEPTMGITFFNSGFKSDPTEFFPFLVQVIALEIPL
jgi:hypothetical protein